MAEAWSGTLEIYDTIEQDNPLERVDPDTLIDLLQKAGNAANFWTTRLHAEPS